MAEYIERETLLEIINGMSWKESVEGDVTKSLFILIVEDAPAADVAADRILEEGWFRPLCKIGDFIYAVLFDTFPNQKWYVSEEKVTEVGVNGCWTSACCPPQDDMGEWWSWRDFGRTVFVDKKEARAIAKKYMKEGLTYGQVEDKK